MPDSTLRIDLTDDTTIAAAIASLDDTTTERLAQALRNHTQATNERKILDAIRAVLTEDAAVHPGLYAEPDNQPVGVLFHAMEWDNGHFLSDNGLVLLRDGSSHDIDFDIDPLLTDEYGPTGENTTLAVDLRTDTLEFDTYGSHTTIHEHFNISAPCPAYRPENPATLAWWSKFGDLPDDLTIDGTTFTDPGHAIGYLTLKGMAIEEVLHLAHSRPDDLAARQDRIHLSVANTATTADAAQIVAMAAHVALTNGWISDAQYTRITTT